jgi:anti-sigma factor RsiW
MNPPDWNRLLLAYVDNELTPAERVHVERYLAEHPHAYDLLADLEETGPGNIELWDSMEPPEPSEADWRRASHAITVLAPQRRKRWSPVLVGSLAACALAVIGVAWFIPGAPAVAEKMSSPKAVAAVDPLAEYAVLPVATPDDVMVNAVRGPRDTGFVTVRPPLLEVLALATPDDVEIENPGSGEVTEGNNAMMVWPKK